MRTKEEILLEMVETMPFEITSNVKPYLIEAMDIYAESYYRSKIKSLTTYLVKDIKTGIDHGCFLSKSGAEKYINGSDKYQIVQRIAI